MVINTGSDKLIAGLRGSSHGAAACPDLNHHSGAKAMGARPAFIRAIFERGMRAGANMRSGDRSWADRVAYSVADTLVFSKIRGKSAAGFGTRFPRGPLQRYRRVRRQPRHHCLRRLWLDRNRPFTINRPANAR
jgi:hypothetical protein